MKRKKYGTGNVILHLVKAAKELDKIIHREANTWKWRHYIQLRQEVESVLNNLQT